MRYSDRILKTPSSFIRDILKVTEDPSVISFAGGLPNPISFPQEALKESACRIIGLPVLDDQRLRAAAPVHRGQVQQELRP